MRRYLIIPVLILSFATVTLSQKLNKLGKIVKDELPQIPDFRIDRKDGVYKISTEKLEFEGNSFYRTPQGFITSLEVYDNQKDFVKQYDTSGKLLITILSDRIINLKVSDDGSKVVYNNSDKIILVNLLTYSVDTLPGSFVYAFVGKNDLIYYNTNDKTINIKGNKTKIEEFPIQIIDYKGRIIVITKQNLFELTGNYLLKKYEFKGQFFDAKIIDDVFYVVDKIEHRKSEIFNLYKTTDLNTFILVDKLDELNR